VGVGWDPLGDEFSVLALGGEEVVALGETGGFDCGGDIEDVVALGNGEGLGVNVALDEAGVDLGHGDWVVEAVLACFESAGFLQAEECKTVAAPDDTGLLHLSGDGGGSRVRGDIDEGFGGGAVRSVDDVSNSASGEEEKKQEGEKKLQSCASGLAV